MLARIVRHELRLLRADRAIWLVAGLFIAAVACSIFSGAERVREEQAALDRYVAAHEALVERYRQRAEAIERVETGGSAGPFNLHRNEFTWGPRQPAYVPAWAPFFAVLPPASTAALAVGQSDIYPPVFTIYAVDRELRPSVQPNDNPLKLLLGHFDLAFVVLFLYPLFILALSFDLAASEREQGTLALLLSQPISARVLLAGKTAARAILVLGTLAASATILFVATGTATSAPGALPRLLLWFVAVLIYGAFWFGVALWINSFGRSSAFNALALAGGWLAVTMLAPALLLWSANRLYPLPGRAELVEFQRAADFAASEQRNRASPEDLEQLVNRFIQQNPELREPDAWNEKGEFYLAAYAQRHETARRVSIERQRLLDQQNRQNAFLSRLAPLSPALLMQGALYDIAGTGPARYEYFREEASKYQREFEGFLWPKVFTGSTLASAEFKDIPRFEYREEPLAEVTGRTSGPIAVLIVVTFLVWLLGMRAFGSLPVMGK